MLKKYFQSSLFRSAGIYTFSSMLNSAIPFLLVFILTRHLLPYEYGLIATFQVLVGLLTPFIGLNIQGAIAREYYEKDQTDLPVYITNGIFILITSTIFFTIILYLFPGTLYRMSKFPVEWVWSVIIVTFSQFVSQIVLTLWQVQVKPKVYGFYQVSQSAILFLLVIYFVVELKWGWRGFLLAQVYARGIYGIIGIGVLFKDKWIRFKINKSYIIDALKFGVPLVPHTLGGWLRASADRLLLNKMVSVAENGIYSAGYQMSMLITLVETSFNNAWVPWLYENLKADKFITKLRIVKFTYLYIIAIFIFSLLFALLIPDLIKIFFGKNFSDSGKYIIWFSIAKAIDAVYYMTSNYLFYIKKTMYITVATFSSSVVHVAIAFYLIKTEGSIGAAQATVFSSTLIALLTWYFAAKYFKMPWMFKKEKPVNV